jgi:hypothetical protein
MLGMMPQKGGGSTNVPGNPMNSGGMAPQIGQAPPMQQAGGMPSKGGGMTNMPMGQGGGAGLASLFMNNRPAMPGAGQPGQQLPQITQPPPPVIQDPVRRMPEQPPVAQRPATPMPIRTLADLYGFMNANPNDTTAETNWIRTHNYANRNNTPGRR